MTAVETPVPAARVFGVRAPAAVGALVAATALLRIGYGGVTVADVVLLAVVAGVAGRIRKDPDVARLMGKSAMPLWLFALGSAMSLAPVGFAGWAMLTLFTDAFLLAGFFAVYRLARGFDDAQWTAALRAIGATLAVVTVSVAVFGGGYRPEGTFTNPNYAAHWVAVAVLFIVQTWPGVAPRAVAVAAAGVVMIRTGSFGGMAVLAMGLFIVTLAHARRPQTHLYWRLLAVGLALFSVFAGQRAFERLETDPSLAINRGVSSARFQSSSDTRRELWERSLEAFADHPFGAAPHGIASRNLIGRGAEPHNDYLALLVERGIVGALGFVAFVLVLWRWAPKNGVFRALALAVAAGAVFRETLHFRHLWVFLALALAWDKTRRRVPT